MSSLNSCSFIGRVGKDVEGKELDGGKLVVNYTIAVSERYKDKNGDQKEDTTWVNCVSFGKLAEITQKYVNKGDLLYINGKMSNRQYEKDGVTKYFTEIIVNDMKMLGGNKKSGEAGEIVQESAPAKKASKAKVKEEETDLPF